jgi:hypothetical protein
MDFEVLRKCTLSGVLKAIIIYDFPHFLYPGGSHFYLLDFRMESMACLSGLQPVFKNPPSQPSHLNFMPHAFLQQRAI